MATRNGCRSARPCPGFCPYYDFRAQVAALTEQARQINNARVQQEAAQRQAKIEADQLANLQSLTQRMIVFTTKADATLPKFAPVENDTTTSHSACAVPSPASSRFMAAVRRPSRAARFPSRSIRLPYRPTRYHIGVGSSYQTFDFDSGELNRESAGASQGCCDAHVATGAAPIPVGYEPETPPVCGFSMLPKSMSGASPSAHGILESGNHLDAERREQEQIVQASNMAVQ